MRKTMLAALLAATMTASATADAQDDQGRHGNRAREAQAGQPQQQAQPRGNGGGGERPQRPFEQPQVQALVQAQPQPQAEPQFQRGDRSARSRFAGGRPDSVSGRPDFSERRGGFSGSQRLAQPQVQVPQQAQSPLDRRAGDRNWRGGGGERSALTQADRRDDGRRNDGRRDDRRSDGGFEQRGGYDRRGYVGNRGYDRGYSNQAWNREWRRDDRYNYSAYRNQNRNAFHLPRYYAPSGWNYGYRRFGIGFTLSSFLYGQDYWIDDADYYRLPPAYGPYRWVRYYNDALLVDLRTGYVVDTVYDIFW